MYASYRIEVSPSLYGSEGSLAINNTLKLPDDKLSFYAFKTALMNSVENFLPRIWEAYLLNQELKEAISKKFSEEASLLQSEPSEDLSDEDAVLLEETEMLAATETNEEWKERYSRQF